MSLQLPTKLRPLRHQMWEFSSLRAHASICVFACVCARANVCIYESKGESIFTRWLQGGIGLTLPRAVCREITLLYGSAHTHWSCFDSGFLAQLNLNLVSVQGVTVNRGFDKVVVLARSPHTPLPAGRMSGHLWWYHCTDHCRWTAPPILSCVIPLSDGHWRAFINPNVFVLQTLCPSWQVQDGFLIFYGNGIRTPFSGTLQLLQLLLPPSCGDFWFLDCI